MVSTGELGSWLLYLDKILDPSPSLFAVIAGLCVDSVGEKGKVKAKSKGSASIHLTEWVNGNKWLSFDQLYIRLFSVTTVKDTGASLRCISSLIKWKQTSSGGKIPFCPFSLIYVKLSICGQHHLQLSIIIAWNNAWKNAPDEPRGAFKVWKYVWVLCSHILSPHLAISR